MQSVASYMSSRLPFVEGGGYNEGFAPKECTTLAEALSASGYKTAAIVKNPWLWTRNAYSKRQIVAARGFEDYHTGYMIRADNPLYAKGIGGPKEFARCSDAARAARQVELMMPGLIADGRPFFLYIHLMDTHEPYNPPDEYKALCSAPEAEGIPDFMLHKAVREYGRRRGAEELAPEDMPLFERMRSLYDTCVKYVDDAVGRIIDLFKSEGLYEQTLFVFSADHGEEFGEHGWIGHLRTLYEESLRVPLIIAGAGVAAGRVGEPATCLEIAPTILAACGVKVPGTMFGRPLYFTGAQDTGLPRAFAALIKPAAAAPMEERLFALADPRGMKLIRHEYCGAKAAAEPVDELYDLRTDGGEKANIAAGNEDKVSALAGELEVLHKAYRGPAEEEMEIDEETRRQLRALGYLSN
jgi:arylsulfatase